MKRIISALVVAMLLATCIFVAVPASAANELKIDWTKLDYMVYNDNGIEIDEGVVLDNFNVTKTADTLGLDRKAGGIQANSYIATAQFTLTATTKYTYEVMAKNNYTTKYSGVPFAVDTSGNVYFIYGSFDNNNDSDSSQSGKSYVISAKNDFDNKYPNTTGDELASMYFAKLQQTGGFASFKFVYDGLNVTIYAKSYSDGNYIQMGEVVSLPDGSKIAIGVYSRDNSNGGNRTTTVKNAVVKANNTEAEGYLTLNASNGVSELKAELSKIKAEYLEVNYTETSYDVLNSAINNAEAVVNDAASTASDVSDALALLRSAVSALELKEVDTSALEEAIENAKNLKEIEYTAISYGMVVSALESAEEILDSEDALQSDVDAIVETLNARIAELVSSGIVAEPDPEEEGADDTDINNGSSDIPQTQTPILTQPQTQLQPQATQQVPVEKSCKSALASTAAIIGLVGALGTALVFKKKD